MIGIQFNKSISKADQEGHMNRNKHLNLNHWLLYCFRFSRGTENKSPSPWCQNWHEKEFTVIKVPLWIGARGLPITVPKGNLTLHSSKHTEVSQRKQTSSSISPPSMKERKQVENWEKSWFRYMFMLIGYLTFECLINLVMLCAIWGSKTAGTLPRALIGISLAGPDKVS